MSNGQELLKQELLKQELASRNYVIVVRSSASSQTRDWTFESALASERGGEQKGCFVYSRLMQVKYFSI